MNRKAHDFPKKNSGCQNQTLFMSLRDIVLIDSFCTIRNKGCHDGLKTRSMLRTSRPLFSIGRSKITKNEMQVLSTIFAILLANKLKKKPSSTDQQTNSLSHRVEQFIDPNMVSNRIQAMNKQHKNFSGTKEKQG